MDGAGSDPWYGRGHLMLYRHKVLSFSEICVMVSIASITLHAVHAGSEFTGEEIIYFKRHRTPGKRVELYLRQFSACG